MKVEENGSIELEVNEVQIGQFVVKKYNNSVEISSTSGNWHLTVDERASSYVVISTALEENQDLAHIWIAIMYVATTIFPDYTFLEELNNLNNDCMERFNALVHTETLSEDEDKALIDQMKADQEFHEISLLD